MKEINVNTLDKMDEFNPQVMLTDDLVADIEGGAKTILTTWLVSDGYQFDTQVETVQFAQSFAYYLDNSLLYIIESNWNSEATKALLNQVGTHKLNVNTIIVSVYALTFTNMTELKTNIKLLKDKDFNIKVEVRG
jgi:adenine-specific DNA-methyltransferase